MQYAIFDDLESSRFYPLTLTRSPGDLRAGILKLRQKLIFAFDLEAPSLIVSRRLQEFYRERHIEKPINLLVGDDTLFLNSRLHLTPALKEAIAALPVGCALVQGDMVVAARKLVPAGEIDAETLFPQLLDCERYTCEHEHPLYESLWDIMLANGRNIEADYEDVFYDADNHFETEIGVTILDPYRVWIGEGAILKPGVVIDAASGPVVIDEGAEIMPNAVIMGPVYIGKQSRIKIGAKIEGGTSIGPVCKIGGEIEDTIIQGYTNKQHDGFLGHAFLGEWVNLGADTNNSDLKNTYGHVACHSYYAGRKVDTGSQFVGAMIGDHVKIGINCSLNTGVVIGVGSNLYGPALLRDFIPSLRWGTGDSTEPYRIDKFLDTARRVKARRELSLSEAEAVMLAGIPKLENEITETIKR